VKIISANGSVEEIRSLIHRIRPAAWRQDYPTAVDIDELFQDLAMVERSRIWRTGQGEPCAYAFVHFPYNNLTLEAAEACWTDEWEDEAIDWAEAQMRTHYGAGLAEQTLDGNCRGDDGRMNRFFERHGFRKDDLESLTFALEMSEEPAPPMLPEGFTLRPLRPESELEEVVALHRAAHGTDNFTLEERLAIMGSAEYIAELDLVAVTPDGRLAGNCIGGVSEAGGAEGYTDPVVVHPNYQGKGVAKALIRAGLGGLFTRGVRRVQFGTSSSNIAMQRVASALGFTCVARRTWYSKQLDR